jgi:O-antigen/teichoic acid export membrane protein
MTTSASQSIAKNTTLMFASQIITWGSSFVLMLFLPRYLGTEEYGRLFLAISVTTIFEMIVQFGAQYHIAKEVALSHDDAPDLFVNSVVIRTLLWFLSMIATALFVYFAGYPQMTTNLILILAGSKLWEGIATVARACFQGFERMAPPAVSVVLERLFLMGAGLVALFMGGSSMTIAIVMAVSTLLRGITLMISLPRIIPALPGVDWTRISALVRHGMPYFLWSVFAVVYYRIDAVMLSLMTPDAVVGWYGAAFRIFDILMFFPSIYTTALLPVIARLSRNAHKDLFHTMRNSLEFMLIAGIPIATLVYTFADDMVPFLFGAEGFSASVIIIKLFCLGLVFVYIDFVLGAGAIASDKQRQWSIVALAAIPVNIGLNYLLIPYYQSTSGNGGIGAAIATLATEIFVMGWAIKLLPRNLLRFSWVQAAGRSISAALIMVGVIDYLRATGLNWTMIAAIGVALYVMIMLLYGLVMRQGSPAFITFILTESTQRFISPLRRSNP